jgi:hypothetical protein
VILILDDEEGDGTVSQNMGTNPSITATYGQKSTLWRMGGEIKIDCIAFLVLAKIKIIGG